MDLDWVVCSHCGNVQEEDCDDDSFVCNECDEVFHYSKEIKNETNATKTGN